MRTLAEEYTFNKLKESMMDKTGQDKKENKLTRALKYGAIGGATNIAAQAAGGIGNVALGATGVGVSAPAVAAMGAYYLYRKHKKAKAAAAMEQDPAKKNEMNVKANQMKQDANKKKLLQQKEDRLKKLQQQA